jgi:hypothetical protein
MPMNDDRSRDLAAFANAGAQPNQPMGPQPGGHALVRPTSGIAERVIGAQPVAVYRDVQKVLQKLTALAAAAGSDWFYRFPVKKKDGGVDYIEGPSIKLANAIAFEVGNIVTEIREIDVGDAWVFYARSTDLEGGSSMERAFRQRKSQTSMRTRDADRSLDIAYSIGQSKAIRNVLVNFLAIYSDFAFEQARNSLVEKIGKDIDGWRKRTIEGIGKMPVELNRVERTIGRAAKDWLAPDVARIVAMMRSVADGMASVDEVFPPIEQEQSAPQAEPTSRSDAVGGAQDGTHAEIDTAARMSNSVTGHNRDSTGQNRDSRPAAAAAEADAAIARAYERGKDAKAAGHQRRALPPEYRAQDHEAEADAWGRGFDGKELPSFKE